VTGVSKAEHWQLEGGEAELYERHLVSAVTALWASDLVERVNVQAGDRVLDVACGTGVVARAAADRAGASGHVVGLDINPAMLAVARSVRSSGAAIEWHEASAESLPFADGSFDVVVSSLGLQFVPDKSAALREIWRVLVPDGHLAIGTVGPTPPLFAILEQALARHVRPEVAAFVGAVFSLHEPQELEKLTSGARFRDVDVRSKPLTFTFPGPAEFLWQYVHSTPLAAAVAAIEDIGRTALEGDVVAASRSFVKDDGTIADDVNVVLTTARK
jgi:ubiquinone/menaquinone biosynthesis C-methylase UbiE